MKATHLVLLGFASLLLETQVRSADIVALCIGNDAYVKAEDRLDTPVADATLMRDTLRAIPGVRAEDVVLLPDGTREQIRAALRQFREKARGARLSIVFYSGHGIEDQPTGYDRAETFLLPVDAVIEGAEQLPDRAVGLGEVLGVFTGLPPGGRVVILDCCRTGAPSATKALAGSGKNVSEDLDARVARALGQAELAEGTLVSFSAGPGRKAAAFLKETDAYSPFTHFLAQGIREEGGDFFSIASQASAKTREATGDRQVPRMRFDGDPSPISAFQLSPTKKNVGRKNEAAGKPNHSNSIPNETLRDLTKVVGNPERMSMLNSLRAEIAKMREIDSRNLRFIVDHLKAEGSWAFMHGSVENEDSSYIAVFRKDSNKWVVERVVDQTGDPVSKEEFFARIIVPPSILDDGVFLEP